MKSDANGRSDRPRRVRFADLVPEDDPASPRSARSAARSAGGPDLHHALSPSDSSSGARAPRVVGDEPRRPQGAGDVPYRPPLRSGSINDPDPPGSDASSPGWGRPKLRRDGGADADAPAPSSPDGHDGDRSLKTELSSLVSLAAPMSGTLLCRFAQGFIDLAAVGHYLGTDALAGASLALTVQFTTMGFVTMGFGDAVPALCSQALGAGNKKLMGIWLQLGCLACTLACIPICTLWWFTGDFLRAVGIKHSVAAYAATFGKWSIPRMWAQCMYYCFKSYLASQKIVKPDFVVNVVFVPVNLALNILLINGGFGWDGLGFKGSPIANVAARFGVFLSLWAYAWAFGLYREGWDGWDLKAACRKDRLRTFMKLALPTMLRSTLDLGQVQVVALFAGRLGSAEAATHNTLIQLYAVFGGCWAFGLTDATAIRMGYHLGNNDTVRAVLAAKATVALNLALGVVVAGGLFVARHQIGRIFSHDHDVIHLASTLAPLMGAIVLLTGVCFSTLGILLGQGRMGSVSASWTAGVFLIIPLSYIFAFLLHHDLAGLWDGWVLGYAFIGLCNIYAVSKTDWANVAWKAGQRSEKDAEPRTGSEDREPTPGSLLDDVGRSISASSRASNSRALEVPLLGGSSPRAPSSTGSKGYDDDEDQFDSD